MGGEPRSLQIGQMAVRRGFITDAQLRDALAARARESAGGGPPRPLGAFLVEMGFLTAPQLDILLHEQTGQRPRLGKYALLRELGRGGMGVVFEALDGDLNRKVALKTMNPALEADPARSQQDHDRFVREARLSAQLKHPHIVSVYEAGVVDGRRYLAMELVEGLSMGKWWASKGVGLPRKLRVLRDVARALHHAHAKGVLHRDLKPENVLVGPEDHAYVTDFGLAKSMRGDTSLSITGSGLAVGTPAYMSPEQAQASKGIDGRSDVYSLGVILYEALTGQQPFRGETAIEILMKSSKEPPKPPSTAVLPALAAQDFDAALENICLKALAKKPADRYASAQAFADDLERWLNGEAVVVVPPPSTSSTRRRATSYAGPRRAPVWPWAVGGGLAAVAGIVLLLPSKPAPAPPNPAAEIARQARIKEERLLAELEALKADSRRREEELRRQTQAATAAEREKAERELRQIQERARRAEEEARKLRTSTSPAPVVRAPEPKPEPPKKKEEPPPELAPEEAWAKAVALLPLVDPAADAVSGEWTSRDGDLVSGAGAFAQRLRIPYKPPAEYDLRAELTRGRGGEVVLILSRAGRAFHYQAGTGFSGFSEIGGRRATSNPSTLSETRLPPERRAVILIQVRHDGLAAFIDGRLVNRWRTDYSDLSMDEGWALPDAALLGLGAFDTRARFHRLELREISGPGLVVRAAAKGFSREDEKKARSEATARAVELKAGRKSVRKPEEAVALAREHLEAAELAVEGGDFDLATRLLKDGGDIARQARDALVAADAAERLAALPELRKEYEKGVKAEASQDDAALGRWLCFFRDRWEEGLPLFARGSEAARRELARAPAKEVADAWHDAAQKEKNPERRRLLQRAAFWYHRVEGPDREVERRVASIEKETGSKTWIDLLRRLDPKRDPNTGSWDLASGALTGTADEDWIRYHLPYIPPAEYDLRMTLQRTDGRWEFLLALPLENNQRVGLVMEGYENGDTVGFEYIDGTDADDPPYTGVRAIFDDRKPHAILIQVRRQRLVFWSDGKVLIDTPFDPKKSRLEDRHYGPIDARTLIIGLNSSTYRCTDLQVLPISGPGRLLR